MTGPAPSYRDIYGTDTRIVGREPQNNASEPTFTSWPCFAHAVTRGPGHRPWVTDARSPAPRAPPPACPRFSPAESAPHMSHVTNSLCVGEFRRGRGQRRGARALQGLPIRSAQSRSPHSRVRDGHGAYRLCCGLACGDDARAPRHRASGPRRPLPARARPPPRAGIFRAIALCGIGTSR